MGGIKPIHVIAVVGVALLTGAALVYAQYRKLIDNVKVTFSAIRLKKIHPSLIQFDLYLSFYNYSLLEFDIVSQEYTVFVNNKKVSKLSNRISVHIKPKDVSPVPVAVSLYPQQIAKTLQLGSGGAVNMLLFPDKTILRLDVKLNIKLGAFTFGVPYTYQTNLKEIIKPITTK